VDRFGRLRFLRAGILLFAVSAVGFVWVDSLGPLVYVLRFVQGIAWALAFAGAGAVVIDHAPPERLGQAIGLFGVSMLSMNAVAPPVVEIIAAASGWGDVFLLAAAAAGVSLLLSMLLHEVHEPPDAGEATGVLDVVRRPRTLWFMAIIALSGCAFGAMFTFSQPFALELGMTQISGFFVAYTLAAISVRIALGPLAERVGRPRVSVLASVLYAGSVLAMAALEPGALVWIGAAFGLAHGFFYPAFNALAIEAAAPHERGKFMSIFNAAFNGGWAVGNLALGLVAARAGFPSVFIWAAAATGLGTLLLLASPEVRRSLLSR
jgi:predicted MFS family arabinose efflux permease